MKIIKKIYLKIIRFLASPKTALILLLHIAILSVFAALFPSIDNNEHIIKSYSEIFNNNIFINRFNFQEKFNNNIILGLLISCCLGIGISIYFRLKNELKNSKKNLTLKSINIIHQHQNEAVEILKENNYNVSIKSKNYNTTIIGEKGILGVYGSILFHFSLIVLFIGILLSTFMSFRGSFNLTEGETFNKYLNLNAGKFYSDNSVNVPVKLISYIPKLEVNGSFTEAAIIEYSKGDFKKLDTIYVNNPLNFENKKLYLGQKVGYSPYIEIYDTKGEKVFEGFLRLASTQIGYSTFHRDYIYIDSVRFEFEFFPYGTLNNDASAQLIVKVDGNTTLITQAGIIYEGNNYKISYLGYRRWVSFDVKQDPGVMVIFWSAVLGSVGLALRILFVKKKIIVNLYEKDRIFYDIAISTEKFFHIYKDELQHLAEKIEKSLSKITKVSEYKIDIVDEKRID